MIFDIISDVFAIIFKAMLYLLIASFIIALVVFALNPSLGAESKEVHVTTYEEVREAVPADDWQDFMENGGLYVLDLPREADLSR